MPKRFVLRAAAIAAASALVLVGAATSASAHVTVSSPDAKPGGYAKLVFRVPSESDTTSTTKLVVTLPKDHPFASVGAQVKAGWKVEKTKEKLPSPVKVGDVTLTEAITTVTWSAVPGSIGVPPNDFDEFALSVGRLPEGVDSLNFPTVQTYSDGEVVKWEELAKDGADKPEHPAPSLKLTAAITPVAATTNETKDSDNLARILGAAGLLVGLLGLGFGLRPRKTQGSAQGTAQGEAKL